MSGLNETYAKRHHESALQLFEEGHYAKALQQIDKAIQQDPKNVSYVATKGIFYHYMNEPLKAALCYEEALEIDPDDLYSHYNLGLIYMKQGKISLALKHWKAAVKSHPQDLETNFNIAVALTKMEQIDAAMPFYDRVLELDPTHVMTHRNLAVLYRDMGEYTKSKHHFIRLRELDSGYIEAVRDEIFRCEEHEFIQKLECTDFTPEDFEKYRIETLLSDALMELISKNYLKALQTIQEYFDTGGKEDSASMVIHAQALNGMNKPLEAIAVYENLLTRHPASIDALFQLGNVYLSVAEYSEALKCFEKILELDPEHPFIKENINDLHLRIRREKNKAKQTATDAGGFSPSDQTIYAGDLDDDGLDIE
ncbi:MAG: tetratricopeptide repeat protein [Candidatus Riflebacteria bacterium]|nr:tetratricopeptide repeat protein [Candidatus Riflebacteria bacterium]